MVAASARAFSAAGRKPVGPPFALSPARQAQLGLLLVSGGDERLWLDPATRRNRNGVPATPAPDELWFSSSTASAISPRGWASAGEALDRLISRNGGDQLSIEAWFDDIRARLLALYGAEECEVILSASGSEAEFLALSLALTPADRPLVNIIVAPAETGSGVPAAADGRHFLGHASLGGAVVKGERLPGWEDAPISVEALEIRRPDGTLRSGANVDQEAAMRVERAAGSGAFVLLHVLDASKTGRQGVSRAAARQILARHPGQVMVVVDACQLRCSAQAVAWDLASGFAVMLTGSKFAGGPPFSGALLVPAELARRLESAPAAAGPLAPYSAALDWPASLRASIAPQLRHPANLGLGLRWTAALAEIEAFEAVPIASREALIADFDRAVRQRVEATPRLEVLDGPGAMGAPGLTPVIHIDGSDARSVYEALQSPADGAAPPCHLGQPVVVGERVALRVCASMPLIARAAAEGLAAVEADLDRLFDAWSSLLPRRA
ncbi:MAG: hypothetical protein ACHP7N_12760 [Caulobacterales bacterium]